MVFLFDTSIHYHSGRDLLRGKNALCLIRNAGVENVKLIVMIG